MMRCIQHETVPSCCVFGSSSFLTISFFPHLLPLLVPFLEVSSHVLFMSGSEPSLSRVTEWGIWVVEEREERMCWTLRWVGGRLGLGLGTVVGELRWAMKRDCVSMDNMGEKNGRGSGTWRCRGRRLTAWWYSGTGTYRSGE